MKVTTVHIQFKGFNGEVQRFFESKETADHYARIMDENELVENVYRYATRHVWASAINASEDDLELLRAFHNHFHGDQETGG